MRSFTYILFIVTFLLPTGWSPLSAHGCGFVCPEYILNKQIVIDVSDYQIENQNEYDIVRIKQGDLLLEGPTIPVVPYIVYQIDLPLNAEIERLEVKLERQVDLGILNIPVFQPPWPIPDPDGKHSKGGYIEAPINIGVFPTKPYYYETNEIIGYKQVIITIFPLFYDTRTKHAVVCTSAKVKVRSCANVRGIIKKFSTYKSKYTIGSPIKASTTIKNLSTDEIVYSITFEVHDLAGNVVSGDSQKYIVNGSESRTIPMKLETPMMKGAYRLVLKVYDELNIVGSFIKEINVIAR